MKIKTARYISPAVIAMALFLAVALLPRKTARNVGNSGVDYYATHSSAEMFRSKR